MMVSEGELQDKPFLCANLNIAEPRSDDADLESEELDFDDGEKVFEKIFMHLPKINLLLKQSLDLWMLRHPKRKASLTLMMVSD